MKLDEKIKEKSEYNLNYKKIENEIDFEKYTEKETLFSKMISFLKTKKLVVSLTSILLLIVIGSLMIRPNPGNEPKPPFGPNQEEPGNNNSNNISYNLSYNEASLIGIAAYNEFDKNGTSKLSNVVTNINFSSGKTVKLSDSEETNEDKEYLKISYPYDYVKIVSAYKFSINVTDIPDDASEVIIEHACGLGELEVVVAEFETYVEEDGIKYLSVSDIMISLRGHNGYYTILANSGHREEGDWTHIFSSHKKLLEDEISKDFTPPILSIFLEEKSNNERYVYFETSDNLLSFGSYNRNKAFKNTTEIEHVSRSTMYSVFELAKLPTKELVVSIVNIDIESKVIEVESVTKLKYIYYNEHTEGVDIATLNAGDKIKIEYDFLFEEYDPTHVYVNTVTIEQIPEVGVN